jgi:uncharacterized protein (DUF1778 family)
MARPKKDPLLRMDVDLRIPVTNDQKALIAQAAAAEQSDIAAWVRPILLRAAQERIKEDGLGKQRRRR